ncbi:MAG TPA: hypothetical protein VFR03_17615, partial [Thermoanaerobaculia bacterium]|nr:hypothetical protein [Thermoanaerobaculia bacterium]
GGWMKIGCTIEPDGHCLPALPTKTGATIEPDGQYAPTSAPVSNSLNSADLGCQIDPGGRCL